MGNVITAIQLAGRIDEEDAHRTLITFDGSGHTVQATLGFRGEQIDAETRCPAAIRAILTMTGSETFQAVADLTAGSRMATYCFDTMGSGFVLQHEPRNPPVWLWMSRCRSRERTDTASGTVMASRLSLDFTTRTGEFVAVMFESLDAI